MNWYLIGWTFKKFNAQQNDYVKEWIWASSEYEACGICYRERCHSNPLVSLTSFGIDGKKHVGMIGILKRVY